MRYLFAYRDLLGGLVVVKDTGSLDNGMGRRMVEVAENQDHAKEITDRITKRRIK